MTNIERVFGEQQYITRSTQVIVGIAGALRILCEELNDLEAGIQGDVVVHDRANIAGFDASPGIRPQVAQSLLGEISAVRTAAADTITTGDFTTLDSTFDHLALVCKIEQGFQ